MGCIGNLLVEKAIDDVVNRSYIPPCGKYAEHMPDPHFDRFDRSEYRRKLANNQKLLNKVEQYEWRNL